MKSYLHISIFLLLIFCSINKANAQNSIGIGLNTPSEKLHIDSGNIKIGNVAWSSSINNSFLKFGDGNFVTIGEEEGDDHLTFRAYQFNFKPYPGYPGRVAIGNNVGAATATLHIKGNIRIDDGTAGTGKVLTSNSNGTATWQSPTPTQVMKVCIAMCGIYPSFGGGGCPAGETYLGEIKVFPYTNVPNGWMECQGQLLPISTNAALFTLLGTTYGGDGVTNFALPNLTGKTIIGN